MGDGQPVQDRLAGAALLGTGEQYLWRDLVPEPDRGPGVVSERPAVLVARNSGRRVQLRDRRWRCSDGLREAGTQREAGGLAGLGGETAPRAWRGPHQPHLRFMALDSLQPRIV